MRTKALATPSRVAHNPVWAGCQSHGLDFYSIAMCHDDHKGNCLLSVADRRSLQSDEIHEFGGKEMEDWRRLDI
jgi:hypothetical protein